MQISATKSTKTKRQIQQHERIVKSTRGLVTNFVFLLLGFLLLFTLFMSLGLGSFLLSKHNNQSNDQDERIIRMVEKNSKDSSNNIQQQQQQVQEEEEQVIQQPKQPIEVNLNEDNNDKNEKPTYQLLQQPDVEQEEEEQQQQQQQQQQQRNLDYNNNSNDIIPYDPPFAPIPNGKQLAEDMKLGTKPTMGGIVHVLQSFLLQLRNSNKELQNIPNTPDGENLVRYAYFNLTKQYLTPYLDKPYRNKTIFPVRVNEESIYISLAAYREHLLYDTLKGAFSQALHPEKIHVGIVMQNCFGYDDQTNETYKCYTGVQVIGKNPKTGKDMTKVSETTPDKNGVTEFCSDPSYKQYCDMGHVRLLSVHESESLGPAIARYYASKLWYGETYYLQVDSHLEFTNHWDIHYINELKSTSNYPKSILSMYPPGFGHLAGITPGTRLCTCSFSDSDVEDQIIRINNGMSYSDSKEYARPTQIPFIAAGFFFTRAEFLQDVPFDPYLPWCFMGEEIALSMRAWTSGWNIYAPRKNWIAHQYRPGRLGLPKFWETVGRTFHRGIGISNRLQSILINRIKHLIGYPEQTIEKLQEHGTVDILEDIQYYNLGTIRTAAEYTNLTKIDFVHKKCNIMHWCNQGTLD